MDPDILFVYGTLQFPEVLVTLLGRFPDREPAAAAGWRAAALPGRVYPGLVPAQGIARGFLLTGLTAGDWHVLDAFEGPAYELTPVSLVDGRQAWSYVLRLRTEAGAGDWSATDFHARHLSTYVEGCAAFRRQFR